MGYAEPSEKGVRQFDESSEEEDFAKGEGAQSAMQKVNTDENDMFD